MSKERWKLFILSGPSCVGKTTLLDVFLQKHPEYPLQRVVTCTTRPKRPEEIDGKDYHFLSPEDFNQKIRDGLFLEFTQIYGTHFYGTLIDSVIPLLQTKHLLLTIDVKGAHAILNSCQKRFPNLSKQCVTIFLKPTDLEILKERLQKRKNSSEEVAQRIAAASLELQEIHQYHHIISSGTIEANEKKLDSIYKKETLV